jgi:DNA-binding NarL/FixJ family response regulator
MKFRNNELFFIIFLMVIAIMSVADLIGDYQEHAPPFHLFQESLIVLASVGGIGYLLWEVATRRREMEQLKQQLDLAHSNLSESHERSKDAKQPYREVINQQFVDWAFTPSERDVGLLLLKGLSFEEIASVRETKEKTVRQQATAIYRKSGLSGRHEFAAWFFEDFLQ